MTRRPLAPYPTTRTARAVDTYHGVSVADDYRWLEDGTSPEVRTWTAAQNRYTRDYLDGIAARPTLHARLHELYTAASSDYYALKVRGGLLFALKHQPPSNQPRLVTLDSPDQPESERVVLDPVVLDPGGTTTIDFYVPSRDGRLVAVSLSANGSEQGTLHVYDVATGRELGDTIPGVTYPTAGGSVAWSADASTLYYTRYPHGDERPAADHHFYQQVYVHRLGTDTAADTYVIGADFPRIAEIHLESSDDHRWLLASVANGDGGEHAHYLMDEAGQWTQVTRFEDEVVDASFGAGATLVLLSYKDAPRGKLLCVPLAAPVLANAQLLVDQSEHTIQSFVPTATRLYVTELTGGPSQIRVYGGDGTEQGLLPTEPISAIGQVVGLDADTIIFRSTSFRTPPAWYRFDPAEEEPAATALAVTSPADFGDAEVVRVFATSRDGTQVPLNIMYRKGLQLDGTNPTILYAYGGYGISLSPGFAARRRLWLDLGGVYVIANLRGGGEYGEDWHRAGNLVRKQNVFDDFLASAEHLIAAGYTSPARLAIEGGSNGGLLMGAALTQRPDLFAAVLAYVGIYDSLRVELDPNGAFNVTEFGTVADPEHFAALHAYSPFHRVVEGTAYPAAMFITGENDGRVNPAHSRRMTARLQAASSAHRPILLRTSSSAGHGIGTALSERIEQDADVFAFLVDQLDIAVPEA